MEEAYDAETARLLEKWPVLHIFKAGRQSFQSGSIILATLGLLLALMAGRALDFMWTSSGAGHVGRELREAPPPLVIDYKQFEDDQRVGLFALLREHTHYCVEQSLTAARKLQFSGGMGAIRNYLNSGGAAINRPDVGEGYGVAAFLIAMLNGWFWVARQHWFFALLCGGVMLALWAWIGGAICRTATLRFARDEYLSYREALQFSSRRFWSFFLGPGALLVMIGLIGLGIILVTLVCNGLTQLSWLAWLGWILVGLLFVLALVAGILIAMITFGLLGGAHLMWPTVAAEGSDFTDAISRSGYFLQAIERAIGYAVVALVYGALAWTVVRGVALLAVWATHGFMELGLGDITRLWATPTFAQFYVPPEVPLDGALSGGFAPFMIKMWVSLFGLVVAGYLVSYYFNSCTIIYHLLRRAVDETELDDIYLEGGEEEGLITNAERAIAAEPHDAEAPADAAGGAKQEPGTTAEGSPAPDAPDQGGGDDKS